MQRLAVSILVSGIILDEQKDFVQPWNGPDGDVERQAFSLEASWQPAGVKGSNFRSALFVQLSSTTFVLAGMRCGGKVKNWRL